MLTDRVCLVVLCGVSLILGTCHNVPLITADSAVSVTFCDVVCWSVKQDVTSAAVGVDVVNDFRTIFTGAQRHTYLDRDYSYTDSEARWIQQHKQMYIDFIEVLRKKRLGHLSAL